MIVRRARAIALFWYDFVVGDDWRLALGVVFALGLTALLAHVASVPVWWVAPVVVLLVLVVSTWHTGRKGRSPAA